MGAGLGLRCNVASNFSLTADYGWQLLKTTPPQPNRGRASIKATLTY
jgi:hemolysin activation/secretion protein